MVTAPKPPGSSTLISPPPAVFEMAPAKVLHGAVRLHGLASSPTPETQVRVAWAEADPAFRAAATSIVSADRDTFIMASLPAFFDRGRAPYELPSSTLAATA